MTLLQNVRHRTVEEHRRRNVDAAARDILDAEEDCRKGKVAACRAVDPRDEPEADEEVARELFARQTTLAKAKATTTSAAPKITLLIPPKGSTTSGKSTSTPAVSSKDSSTSAASSTSLASSTSVSSISSTSSTSSVVSKSSTSSIPSSTFLPSTTSDRALPSMTSSSLIPSVSSASKADTGAESSSGIKTTTLIGVIAGAVGAVLVIAVIAGFFLRRLRTKRKGGEEFNPSEFRRSAVMLDEKDKEPAFRPRPPTMIERHVKGNPANNNMPPPPSLAYPYSDRISPPPPSAPPSMYGANGSDHGNHQASYPQYGSANAQYANIPPTAAGAMYNGVPVVPPPGPYGAHYEQAGYGAPPVPGTYAPGAYASYGPDPRFQQQQYQQQQQGYPHYSTPYQHQPQHPGHYPGAQSFPIAGYGPNGPAPQRMESLTSSAALPNPFARSPAPSSSPPSPIVGKQTLHHPSSSDESSGSGSGSGLRRQPTQSSGAPPAYVDETGQAEKYRDVKMRPVQLSPPAEYTDGGSSTSTSASNQSAGAGAGAVTARVNAGGNTTTAKRTSAYSLYDQDDVYGGI